jgi:hypothetical protein
VKLVVTTDCGVDSTTTTFNNIGIDEGTNLPMVFYPNPTSNVLKIATNGQTGKATIELYSMVGSLIQRSSYESLGSNVRLDLSSLPAGMYTVKVQTATGTVSQNISKL